MKFTETNLSGVYIVELERHEDERGWFARAWCREEFVVNGLPSDLVQCNLSHNAQRGTLRGLHFQIAPYAETKLVRCVAGAVYDMTLDLRPDSPTFGQTQSDELSDMNGRLLWVPAGFAHGFCVLGDTPADLLYKVDAPYNHDGEGGILWSDPELAIAWPLQDPMVSARDQTMPTFAEHRRGTRP